MTTWLRGTLGVNPRQSLHPAAADVFHGLPGPLVVKLGGSLLARPAWPDAVGRLLAALPAPCLLVVGGGGLVDGLRAVDAATTAPPDLVHRLAIGLMGVTARLAAALLDLPVVATADSPHPVAVLDVPTWLGRDDRLARLPVGWHVTSDSIAAAATPGGRLLLIKSVPPPCPGGSLDDAVAAGWIDGHFPVAAARLGFVGWAAPAQPA